MTPTPLNAALALIALLALGGLARWALARWLGHVVGGRALARQPDTIRLVPATPGVWKDPNHHEAEAAELRAEMFRDAGTYTVAEMPGVALRLLAHEGDSILAIIYEAPRAGSWVELVSRYADGSSASCSSLPPTGLDPRPGSLRLNLPGSAPSALLARLKAERPAGTLEPVRGAGAARDFERAFAADMAWRKRRGISGREVATVASRMKRSA